MYCPEAWYHTRVGHTPNPQTLRQLRAGTAAHQQIGRATEHLVTMDQVRRALLVALVLVVFVLAWNWLGPSLPPLPG